jgi:hypothetical protein
MQTVDSVIQSLRAVVGAKNDAELARQLKIDQSTISSWRARGRVPARFATLLEAEPVLTKDTWPELYDRGTAVALARYVILRSSVTTAGDIETAFSSFADVKPFWLIMNRATLELRAKMKALNVELNTAAALILQEDLRDPKATEARVAAQLSEDLKDNPWLTDWT